MSDQPVRYAVLRDLDRWDESAQWAGLERLPDGALALARVPGVAAGQSIAVPGAAPLARSGLAAGDCQDLFIADTQRQRVIRLDSLCGARAVLGGGGPSPFTAPRGLLAAHDNVYIADSGRIWVFRLPSLELRATWDSLLSEPVALAADSRGHVDVLDTGLNRIVRFNLVGVPDDAYNLTLEQTLTGLELMALAVDGHDTLYVAHQPPHPIARVDKAGLPLPPIEGDQPIRPGTMAARGNRLYVADDDTGAIWAFDCAGERFLGPLGDYTGPVTALALDANGALYIKPGLDETYYVLQPGAACVTPGQLTAGPFDAGAGSVWERVHAEVDLPEGTRADLQLFSADAPDPAPTAGDYTAALALDTLVTPGRFLWLRAALQSNDGRRASPVLRQVQAETTAPSYMQALPAVYRREDAAGHFLQNWLALFRAALGDQELALGEMSGRFDPLTAPEADLRWLASWLAFDPPADLHGDELRRRLRRVHALYDRRGTPVGLCEMIALYTGVRPVITEAFHTRRIWQLGYTSTLDLDTTLAAGLPAGMIVPGQTLAEPSYQGLRGDYYAGVDFRTRVLSRIDARVDFAWSSGSPAAAVPNDKFSVRWTGQIRPRYSENYVFHVVADDGVRLYVDGRLMIDQWRDQPPTEYSSALIRLDLEAERWYSIQLDYYENTGDATIQLYWSSRSQPKEIVPEARLYAVRDDHAQLELSPLESAAGGLLIGQTVVGESGPLEQADFGQPLFSETAHLFTVSVPAAALPTAAQREMLKRIIDAEKPAHTDYELCFVEPRLRAGVQARVGVDSLVAGPPPPLSLGDATLGLAAYLAADEPGDPPPSRLGQQARLGKDTRVS